jgi:DAACS family dicarboxylate/amino acid:cation (Na+ or H+) symporter
VLLIFSLFVSLAMLMGPEERVRPLVDFFQAVFSVCTNVAKIALKLTPVCLLFLAFDAAARLGLDLLASLLLFLVTFYAAWLFAFGVAFPISLRFLGGRAPIAFYRQISEPMWFAATTTSSCATFPLSLRTATEKLGLPESRVKFVLTLGMVANQLGASVFLAISALFLADIFNIALTNMMRLEIFALCVGFGFACPGVPGGLMPLLATLCLLLGIPPKAVAIVLSVERIVDIGVTTINVGADLVLASVLTARTPSDQTSGGEVSGHEVVL